MTPYVSFEYFGILALIAVPTIAIAFAGIQRLMQAWIIVASVIMYLVIYTSMRPVHHTLIPLACIVLCFLLFEWGVFRAFMYLRTRSKHQGILYAAVFLASIPALSIIVDSTSEVNRSIVGFAGTLFITFRALALLFDASDDLAATPSMAGYLAFIGFFPTATIGPIDRYRRFETDWTRTRAPAEIARDVRSALDYICTGFLLKFIIAALIARFWLIPSSGLDVLHLISFMYGYMFYSFFDLAGYTAFALGVSYFFGIHTPGNFNKPFLARNIRDFWNRWHISLSWWFRDYVYSRFVYAALKGRWFRYDVIASWIGFMLVMILMGLTHRAVWMLVFYGLYMGALLIIYDIFHRFIKRPAMNESGRVSQALSIFLTFNAVSFGFLLFSEHLSGLNF